MQFVFKGIHPIFSECLLLCRPGNFHFHVNLKRLPYYLPEHRLNTPPIIQSHDHQNLQAKIDPFITRTKTSATDFPNYPTLTPAHSPNCFDMFSAELSLTLTNYSVIKLKQKLLTSTPGEEHEDLPPTVILTFKEMRELYADVTQSLILGLPKWNCEAPCLFHLPSLLHAA